MDWAWIIVDGYSLVHADAGLRKHFPTNLARARQELIRHLERNALHLAPRLTVVFDGQSAGRDEALEAGGLEILFSARGASADSVVERMVSDAADPGRILVVTGDMAERRQVHAAGASSMSGADFFDLCAREHRDRSRRHRARPTAGFRRALGDAFPDDQSRT